MNAKTMLSRVAKVIAVTTNVAKGIYLWFSPVYEKISPVF